MREIRITAFYRDGRSRLLVGTNIKYMGYRDDNDRRPERYETHTVLDMFELEFISSTARHTPGLKFRDIVTITKEPDGLS